MPLTTHTTPVPTLEEARAILRAGEVDREHAWMRAHPIKAQWNALLYYLECKAWR